MKRKFLEKNEDDIFDPNKTQPVKAQPKPEQADTPLFLEDDNDDVLRPDWLTFEDLFPVEKKDIDHSLPEWLRADDEPKPENDPEATQPTHSFRWQPEEEVQVPEKTPKPKNNGRAAILILIGVIVVESIFESTIPTMFDNILLGIGTYALQYWLAGRGYDINKFGRE